MKRTKAKLLRRKARIFSRKAEILQCVVMSFKESCLLRKDNTKTG